MGKNTIGTILIIAGIVILPAGVLLSSAYDGDDSLHLKIIRALWTGEIVLRERVIKVIPDTEGELSREFMEFKKGHGDGESLDEGELIERFYAERYRDRMPRVAFNLKLEKKQVVTIRQKIAVSNRHVVIACLLLITAGVMLRLSARKRMQK